MSMKQARMVTYHGIPRKSIIALIVQSPTDGASMHGVAIVSSYPFVFISLVLVRHCLSLVIVCCELIRMLLFPPFSIPFSSRHFRT